MWQRSRSRRLDTGHVASEGVARPRIKVLVAEEDATVRYLLRCLFSDHGLEVSEAASGAQAKAYLERDETDVVVLEWRMHDGGLALPKALVSEYGMFGRVIMLSTLSDPRDQRAALEAGVARYFVKPARADLLVQAVLDAARRPAPLAATA
jgi:DNA-binding response OmpR family regulator